MNKIFLFLLLILILLIIGITVFLLYKKPNELFENNLSINDFDFNTNNIYDTIYTKNTIFSNQYIYNSNTNFNNITDFDNDGKKLENTIFTNFLFTRSVLKNKTNNSYENFKVASVVAIEFNKKNNFLEIQFTGKDNNIILKFTLKSSNDSDENINIDSNILNTGSQNINYNNTNKFIKTIEFSNISIKKNNNIFNIFYIKSYYSNGFNKIETIFNLPDGIDNHFCENLLNVYVYTNPLNPIKIINNFVADIYLENIPPKIKSKKIPVTESDLVATTYNGGKIYRPKPVGDFLPLGDYMYGSESPIPSQLPDALLIDSKSEYVKLAENVGYAWDDDYTKLMLSKNAKLINSLGTRTSPLILFTIYPTDNFKPLGDYAFVDNNRTINSDKLKSLRDFHYKNRNKAYTSTFKQLTNKELPYLLINSDCLEPTGLTINNAKERWNDRKSPVENSAIAMTFDYSYNYSGVETPVNLAIYGWFHNLKDFYLAKFRWKSDRVETIERKNFKIKDEFLISLPRDPIPQDDIKQIKDEINAKLTSLPTIPPTPINNNISPYISQINKEQTDSQLMFINNNNFNKKMENIQTDYNNNYSYITEINKQLSDIRQKEKAFVQNQIKKQFENDETNFQTKFKNDIKKQAEELKKYDNDISQTSTTIGNQINEYVVLRKHRELMPTNSQVMY